jgi:predicted peroxiredoxin
MAKKKMLFFLIHGLDALQLARACFMFATISAMMDVETTIYCIMGGAEVLVKGTAEKDSVAPGKPNLVQRMDEAIKAGVRIVLCDRTLRAKDISPEELIPEAKIVGAATLIDLALDADATLTF